MQLIQADPETKLIKLGKWFGPEIGGINLRYTAVSTRYTAKNREKLLENRVYLTTSLDRTWSVRSLLYRWSFCILWVALGNFWPIIRDSISEFDRAIKYFDRKSLKKSTKLFHFGWLSEEWIDSWMDLDRTALFNTNNASETWSKQPPRTHLGGDWIWYCQSAQHHYWHCFPKAELQLNLLATPGGCKIGQLFRDRYPSPEFITLIGVTQELPYARP